eukprot:3853064-Rhodomonas_salina.2
MIVVCETVDQGSEGRGLAGAGVRRGEHLRPVHEEGLHLQGLHGLALRPGVCCRVRVPPQPRLHASRHQVAREPPCPAHRSMIARRGVADKERDAHAVQRRRRSGVP